MAAVGVASMAPFLTLTKGQKLRIDALDPVSGDPVSGVTVSKFSVAVDQHDTVAGDGPPADTPWLVPVAAT